MPEMSLKIFKNPALSFFRQAFLTKRVALVFLLLGFFILSPSDASASAYLLSPTSGSFSVGSTFDVSILLDTEGKSVNALDVNLKFPADKLQLVSPKTSVSVISVWTSQPRFNNQEGTVVLQGGIPKGVVSSNAVVATLTFRVKAVGTGILKFLDNSKILLNDGLGTDDLSRSDNAVYTLILPPPAGPIVVSETHPDQSVWYANPTAILNWASETLVQQFSYVLNDDPVSIVDDTSEGTRTQVVYKNLSDGKHFFHIKSLRDGVWGGLTHFGIKVDTVPPADFPIDILPSARTTIKQPIINFLTSDTLSGINHYELKVVSLQPTEDESEKENGNLFIEVQNPYVPAKLDYGAYDVIVRAYDNAGNYTEKIQHLAIVNKIFNFVSLEGIVLGDTVVMTWPWFLVFLLFFISMLAFFAIKAKRRHDLVHANNEYKKLPTDIEKQLQELKTYKNKYGAMAILVFFLGASLLYGSPVFAQEVRLSPPYVTTISRDISNDEIFYIGGKTDDSDTEVIIYTQNLETGETISYSVRSDNHGAWFYRHNSFLTTGRYLLWTQAKVGDQLSPPSSQVEMSVHRTAFQIGLSRVSFEAIYLIFIVILGIFVLFLLGYIIFHTYHSRVKHRVFMKEVREAEESIKRGFAIIRRDIAKELEAISKLKLNKSLHDEEKAREEELLRDLNDVEQRIGKEVWDVENVERRGYGRL